jgi:hypothetical protein
LIALRNAAHHGEHQAKSQFRGAVSARRQGDDDPRPRGGFDVYVIGMIARLRDEFEIGQRLKQRGGKLGALANRYDRLRPLQRFDQRRVCCQLFGEDSNLGLLPQPLDRFGPSMARW